MVGGAIWCCRRSTPSRSQAPEAALTRAAHLARLGWGARVAPGVKGINYHHFLWPRHALVLAEGVRVESLFPGRLSLAAFQPEDRASLLACLARGCPPASGQTAPQAYGGRCLPLLTLTAARLWHQTPSLAEAQRRNHRSLLALSVTV